MSLLLGTLKGVPFVASVLALTDYPFSHVIADLFWIERLQGSSEMLNSSQRPKGLLSNLPKPLNSNNTSDKYINIKALFCPKPFTNISYSGRNQGGDRKLSQGGSGLNDRLEPRLAFKSSDQLCVLGQLLKPLSLAFLILKTKTKDLFCMHISLTNGHRHQGGEGISGGVGAIGG